MSKELFTASERKLFKEEAEVAGDAVAARIKAGEFGAEDMPFPGADMDTVAFFLWQFARENMRQKCIDIARDMDFGDGIAPALRDIP